MKVAITSSHKTTVSGNADECLKFWIYTIENEKVIDKQFLELEDIKSLSRTFYDSMIEPYAHPIFAMDMLLTNEISAQITSKLKEKRTVAFIVDDKDLDSTINQLIKGTLQGHIAEEHNCNCGHDH